jgi:hypothetical protein
MPFRISRAIVRGGPPGGVQSTPGSVAVVVARVVVTVRA